MVALSIPEPSVKSIVVGRERALDEVVYGVLLPPSAFGIQALPVAHLEAEWSTPAGSRCLLTVLPAVAKIPRKDNILRKSFAKRKSQVKREFLTTMQKLGFLQLCA
jgi:hypothetical protein